MSESAGYTLRITTVTQDERLIIVPYVEALEAATLGYEMVSRKEGPSGASTSRQTGNMQVACCTPTPASRLTLRLQPEDRYTITVKLFFGSRQVAEQTIHHP